MAAAVVLPAGCGTTRWSDTQRTGTEQLLISSAIDKAVNNIDFTPLAGKEVYFDTQFLSGSTDQNYVIGSLRQQMMAQGCQLKTKREEARYIVEARIGALGTNRRDVMLGVPATNIPSIGAFTGMPAAIPEVPVAKTTDQEGIAKLAVFAYNRETLQPVWQSGAFPVATNAKDTWMLGIGPFQRGSIYDGTKFAGSRLIFSKTRESNLVQPKIPITAEAIFDEPPMLAARATDVARTDAPAADPHVSGEKVEAGTTESNPGAELQPAQPPAGPASDVPSGRIVRLPMVEQAAHSEAEQPKATETQQDAVPETANKDSESFNLLEPRTWF